jgi:hypothetical protein
VASRPNSLGPNWAHCSTRNRSPATRYSTGNPPTVFAISWACSALTLPSANPARVNANRASNAAARLTCRLAAPGDNRYRSRNHAVVFAAPCDRGMPRPSISRSNANPRQATCEANTCTASSPSTNSPDDRAHTGVRAHSRNASRTPTHGSFTNPTLQPTYDNSQPPKPALWITPWLWIGP